MQNVLKALDEHLAHQNWIMEGLNRDIADLKEANRKQEETIGEVKADNAEVRRENLRLISESVTLLARAERAENAEARIPTIDRLTEAFRSAVSEMEFKDRESVLEALRQAVKDVTGDTHGA